METATFSMDNTVSMEPKKASTGMGAGGAVWGLGCRASWRGGAGLASPVDPPLWIWREVGLLLRSLENLDSRSQDPSQAARFTGSGRHTETRTCCLELSVLRWRPLK